MGDMISGDALIYLFIGPIFPEFTRIYARESPGNCIAVMRKQSDAAGGQRPRDMLEGDGGRSSGLAGPYGG